MPLDPQKLLSLRIPDVAQRYSKRDVILHALAVGFGQDPLDRRQLAFVTEQGLKVAPTFAVTLAFSPFWLRDLETGVDFLKAVHGEESLVLHRPLPAHGYVTGRCPRMAMSPAACAFSTSSTRARGRARFCAVSA